MDRRLVGIDLGIASTHTVRVLREDGGEVCRRRAYPTVDSLTAVEQAALAGAAAGTRLEVVVEPTGPAWLPVAVFFTARGHVVYRVSSAKAADLRPFFSRHAKSNGIDAETLARLTRAGAEHKTRIKDLVRQLMPASPLTGDLGLADLGCWHATRTPTPCCGW